jgi:hypothetical protein
MSVNNQAQASARQMYQGQPGTSATTLYTAPAANANVTSPSATAYITEIILTNTTATAATITLGIVPSAGSLGVANEIMTAVSIPANSVQYFSGLKTYMSAQSFLSALQGTSGAITVTISGVEVQ